ncbi:MAG: hypothetical protein ACTSWR_05300 [Candidatus Helarchaeota archaeon]
MGLKLKELVISETINFSDISHKTIVIDATNLLFKYITKIKNSQDIFYDYHGNPVSHIYGFFYFIINLIERKIKPIFIFDGIPPREKRPYNYYKIKRLSNAWKKYNSLGGNGSKLKVFKDSFFLYKYIIEDLIKFIRMFGVPVFRAPSEGEAQAVRLVKEQQAYGVISEDYDCLIFGCPKIYRKLNFKTNTLQQISLNKVLTKLDISFNQLIDIIILMGNDYHPGFEGFGPKTSLKMIKKYGNIETMRKDYEFNEFDANKIRNLFLKPITSKFDVYFQYPNILAIKEYLLEKNFSINRVRRGLARLNKGFKDLKIKQKRIDHYIFNS